MVELRSKYFVSYAKDLILKGGISLIQNFELDYKMWGRQIKICI